MAAWVGAAAIFVTMLVIGYRAVSDAFACTPVTPGELASQEAFVIERVPDAFDVDGMVMDCDDDGVGSIAFKTHLTPAAAQAAFLADATCQPYKDDDPADITVACPAGHLAVYVFFETPPNGGATGGELTLTKNS